MWTLITGVLRFQTSLLSTKYVLTSHLRPVFWRSSQDTAQKKIVNVSTYFGNVWFGKTPNRHFLLLALNSKTMFKSNCTSLSVHTNEQSNKCCLTDCCSILGHVISLTEEFNTVQFFKLKRSDQKSKFKSFV